MDYIIPSKAAANAMVHLWDTKKTGLRHLFQDINRMCITSDFANGELAKWNISAPDPKRKISGQICGDNGNTLWDCGFPYVDFYVGRDHPVYKGEYNAFAHCRNMKADLFPTQRKLFYNGTLYQRVPPNPEQILRTYYGQDWKSPPAQQKRSPHGGKLCPYGPKEGQVEIKSPPPLVDHTKIETSIHNAGCLFFQCEKNATLCDNNNPTEYNGSTPPCCVHILRDVAHEFDSEMCRIGVDYIATFGTLLGLIRSDRLIPWTGDMDYIIPSKAAANAMVHLWDTKKTGLRHLFQDINRMCITSDFANGELAKWNISAPDPKRKISGQICGDNGNTLWDCGFPYVDFYVGRDHPVYKGEYNAFAHCRNMKADLFPTQRKLFYNGTLYQRVPPNPEQILRTYYGQDWKSPPAQQKRSPHGGKLCPYGPTV